MTLVLKKNTMANRPNKANKPTTLLGRIGFFCRVIFYKIVFVERYIGKRFMEFLRKFLSKFFLIFQEFLRSSYLYSVDNISFIKYLKFLFV